jgi:hypothetical protein
MSHEMKFRVSFMNVNAYLPIIWAASPLALDSGHGLPELAAIDANQASYVGDHQLSPFALPGTSRLASRQYASSAQQALAEETSDVVVPISNRDLQAYLRRVGAAQTDLESTNPLFRLNGHGVFSVVPQYGGDAIHIKQYMASMASPDRLTKGDLEIVVPQVAHLHPDVSRLVFTTYVPDDSAMDAVTFQREGGSLRLVRLNNSGSWQHFRARQIERALTALGFQDIKNGYTTVANGPLNTKFFILMEDDNTLSFDTMVAMTEQQKRSLALLLGKQFDQARSQLSTEHALTLARIDKLIFNFPISDLSPLSFERMANLGGKIHPVIESFDKSYRAYLDHHVIDEQASQLFAQLFQRLTKDMVSQSRLKPIFRQPFQQGAVQTQRTAEGTFLEMHPATSFVALRDSFNLYQQQFANPETLAIYTALMKHLWAYIAA